MIKDDGQVIHFNNQKVFFLQLVLMQKININIFLLTFKSITVLLGRASNFFKYS